MYYKYNITSSSGIFTTIQTFLTTIGFTVIESSPTSASKKGVLGATYRESSRELDIVLK